MGNKAGTVTTILNLPSRTYQAGTFTSPTYTAPAGVSEINTVFDIDPADLVDPTKTMTFECDKFNVADQVWRFDHGFQWRGGGTDKNGNPAGSPSMGVDGVLEGDQLRAIIIINLPLTTAIVVTAF